MNGGHNKINLIGQRFGRLIVIGDAGRTKQGKTSWLCRCDCGGKTISTGSDLKMKNTSSCGCLRRDDARARFITHGGKSFGRVKREYRIWQALKNRCLNPHNSAYRYYGGRGIGVCREWINSFEAFLKDMGPCPEGYTIERRDNNGNYDPNNCEWADRKTQANNRRRQHGAKIERNESRGKPAG